MAQRPETGLYNRRAMDSRRMEVQRPGGPANLADILERVLDKGIVIAGDIQINLLDIELLTIKLRLLVASVERAQEMGINWWESDPTLSSNARSLERENESLRERLERLPGVAGPPGPWTGGGGHRRNEARRGDRAGAPRCGSPGIRRRAPRNGRRRRPRSRGHQGGAARARADTRCPRTLEHEQGRARTSRRGRGGGAEAESCVRATPNSRRSARLSTPLRPSRRRTLPPRQGPRRWRM